MNESARDARAGADRRPTVIARHGARRLTGRVASPRADARLLLAYVLGCSPTGLVLAAPVDDTRLAAYVDLLDRRATGVPVQHLTGEAWFRGVRVEVGPGVFIPRPETELMAGAAVDALRAADPGGGQRPLAVELCAGSGAISAVVAEECPGARIVAIEVDPAALWWTRHNLEPRGIEVRAADLGDPQPDLTGRADVVVANPPYVPTAGRDPLPDDVAHHDPAIALYGGPDGLDVIRRVEVAARRLLRPGGVVLCEHDDSHRETAPKVFGRRPGAWREIADHRDLAGRPRWLSAIRGPGADAPGADAPAPGTRRTGRGPVAG